MNQRRFSGSRSAALNDRDWVIVLKKSGARRVL
jgi:hypothetical protein